VKPGHVFGASDRLGAAPTRDAIRPEDFAATLLTILGIDPETEVRDTLNRPLPAAAGRAALDLIA
jgi:hypothetical protein